MPCASLGPAPKIHQDHTCHQGINRHHPMLGIHSLGWALPLICDPAGRPGGGQTSQYHPLLSLREGEALRTQGCWKPFLFSFEEGRSAGAQGLGFWARGCPGALPSLLCMNTHTHGAALAWAPPGLQDGGPSSAPTPPAFPPPDFLPSCPLTCRTGESDSCWGRP